MSTIRADNFGNRAGTSSISADTLLQGTAKAWVNLNGTGVIAARDSFNCASFTDNGTGDYTATYSVSQPNANYSFHNTIGDASNQLVAGFVTSQGSAQLVGSVRSAARMVNSFTGGSTLTDCTYFQISVTGDPT